MVLSLEDAVTILNIGKTTLRGYEQSRLSNVHGFVFRGRCHHTEHWKDDSAHILAVSESPFQQSRRGILEQRIDWAIGLQGKVSKVAVNHGKKGEKTGTVVLEGSCGHLSLSIGYLLLCVRRTT